jgi:DNA-binding NarL/FixJ family response regulator
VDAYASPERTLIVRIFIASKDGSFKMALQLLLESEPGMVVAGTSDRLEGLPVMVKTSKPDVLLLDYELANNNEMASLVNGLQCPEDQMKVIVLSTDANVREVILASGADGFINMSFPPDELLSTLRGLRLSSPSK